jgi:hypothetical protein
MEPQGFLYQSEMKCTLGRLLFIIDYNSNSIPCFMKEITLRIPDHKLDFVLELIEQLGLEVSSVEIEISEEHKAIVRERIKTAKPEDMIPWEEARKQFTFKKKPE